MVTRPRIIALGLAVGIALFGCTDQNLLGPTDAQLAKGGNKGKSDKTGEPALLEYWVIPDATHGNLIHVAGTGNVDSVNANVVYDYFFNGIRDDNFPSDQHYEYQYAPPLPFPTTQTDAGWHADIPWNGQRATPTNDRTPFPDYLVTDVDGYGGDPFAFDVRFVKGGNVVGGMQPQGVIVGGVVQGPQPVTVTSEFDPAHGEQAVNSYAVFKGDTPAGSVWITSISMSGASCERRSSREGRGKNAVVVWSRRVTADFAVSFGHAGPYPTPTDSSPSYLWVEFHLMDDGTGEISNRAVENAFTLSPQISGTAVMDLPDSDADFDLKFVVDYVFPSGDFMDYTYDPANNSNVGFITTAGIGGAAWTSTTTQTAADLGAAQFPVAITVDVIPVNCN